MATDEAKSEVSENETVLLYEGYGLEVQGHEHKKMENFPKESLVFLPRETRFRLRLCNTNDHECLVSLDIDGIDIGTFLLHPFSKCDLDRPVDRPLGFTFLPQPLPPAPPPYKPARSTSSLNAPPPEPPKPAKVKPLTKKQRAQERTVIKAVFKPELGGKIVQIDLSASHIGKTQRLEFQNETTVRELFVEISNDFGDWTKDAGCMLLHWTTAEYDSPTEDILSEEMDTIIGTFRRRDSPVRKMSLLSLETIEVDLDGVGRLELVIKAIATFAEVLLAVREKYEQSELDDGKYFYFLSDTDRLLCSTKWIKETSNVLQVLHKDEILRQPNVVLIKVTRQQPENCYMVIARVMEGTTFNLEVSTDTTIRECRFQLETLGGPWGEGPKWLFGGTLLESGHTFGFYGIGDHNVVDIVPRLNTGASSMLHRLEMIDPVAVERSNPVNTAALIYQDPSGQKGDGRKRRIHRSGTTLRGKTKQQYIEVDPFEVDDRFFCELRLNIFSREQEQVVIKERAMASDPALKIQPGKNNKAKTCTLS